MDDLDGVLAGKTIRIVSHLLTGLLDRKGIEIY